jgi:hypothetical protein
VGSKLFIKVVPPPMEHPELPWKMVIGGPVAGPAEQFRITAEGYLYSPLVGWLYYH